MTRIRFNPEANFIQLEVLIEKSGQVEELKMALDTGSTLVRIPEATADRLNLSTEEFMETVGVQSTHKVGKAIIPRIIIRDFEAFEVETTVKDLPQESQVDGLLGLSFLKNFDVRLNFKEGYLEFAS